MKDFLKTFFASCLGASVGLVLLFLLLGSIIGAIASMSSKEVAKDEVLLLDFNHIILEKTNNIETQFTDFDATENIGLHDMCALIEKAKSNDKVKGILVKGDKIGVGQATLLQLMRALRDFKTSGKFIYAYSDFYTQQGYLISSVADSIFLNPNGMIDLKGYATVVPFFKKGLDDLGVRFDVFYAGDFKSASEPFRRENMSDENRLQTRVFLEEMLNVMQDEIKVNRGLDDTTTDRIFTNYLGKNSNSALDNKLIDKLAYWSDVEKILREKLGKSEHHKFDYQSIFDLKSSSTNIPKGDRKQKVAVVYLEGEVGYGSETKGNINEQTYQKIFDKIRKSDDIKAVVLRVNSGGGSALTSDIIWYEVEKVKAKGIPVIASFGDYAASGGYYVAAGADTIVSEPNTLTGSIGVFSMLPNAKALLSGKLGINFDSVKTHDLAVGYNAIFDLNGKEKEIFQESTQDIYQQFLSRVAQGRGMTVDEVHAVAQGRVWTGLKGKEIGLVDVIGSLDDAIKIASTQAKLTDPRVVEYPYIKEDVVQQLVKELAKSMNSDDEKSKFLSEDTRKMIRWANQFENMVSFKGPQARLPFVLEVN